MPPKIKNTSKFQNSKVSKSKGRSPYILRRVAVNMALDKVPPAKGKNVPPQVPVSAAQALQVPASVAPTPQVPASAAQALQVPASVAPTIQVPVSAAQALQVPTNGAPANQVLVSAAQAPQVQTSVAHTNQVSVSAAQAPQAHQNGAQNGVQVTGAISGTIMHASQQRVRQTQVDAENATPMPENANQHPNQSMHDNVRNAHQQNFGNGYYHPQNLSNMPQHFQDMSYHQNWRHSNATENIPNMPFHSQNNTVLDPNMAAHIGSLERMTATTQELLQRLSIECSSAVRKDDLNDILRGMDSVGKRGPGMDLPRFNGDSTSSFEEFATSLEEKFNHLNWSEDHPKRVTVMPTILSGLALIKYRQMSPEIRSNYCWVMNELKRQFGIQSKNALHVYNQLKRQQGGNESVQDYSKDILQKLYTNNITDERHMLATYLEGLRSEIRAKVLLMSPQTVSQAESCALTVQEALKYDDSNKTVVSAINQLQQQAHETHAAVNALRERGRVTFRNDYRNGYSSRNNSPSRYETSRYNRQTPPRSYGDSQIRNRTPTRQYQNYRHQTPPRSSYHGNYSQREAPQGMSNHRNDHVENYDRNRSFTQGNYDRNRRDRSFSRDRFRNPRGRSNSFDRNEQHHNDRFSRGRPNYRNSDHFATNDHRDKQFRRDTTPYRPNNRHQYNVVCEGSCSAGCSNCSIGNQMYDTSKDVNAFCMFCGFAHDTTNCPDKYLN